jgi:peptidyl-dipeptidase A
MLQEIDEAELLRLFDELDELTRQPFAERKADLDVSRAKHFGVAVSDLRPWHYGDLFFQEAPPDPQGTLDGVYQAADLVALARTYYAGLGLPCADILAHSDLFEKAGKCPHAFSTDIDRAGDERILCNVKPNLYWADTILHELGHALYDQEIRPDVPFLLHDAAHGLTTEGIAILFGALSKNGDWAARALRLEPAQAAGVGAAGRRALRSERLMFSRWAQVMVRFEQGMYGRPDQDLGKLWWDLKQRYQLLNPPETVARPDYAAKTHILTTPVYYQNYMLGDLFAAQVRQYVGTQVLKVNDWREASFWQRPEVGAWLKAQGFGPGNLYSWNELTERATGASLTAKSFAEEIR